MAFVRCKRSLEIFIKGREHSPPLLGIKCRVINGCSPFLLLLRWRCEICRWSEEQNVEQLKEGLFLLLLPLEEKENWERDQGYKDERLLRLETPSTAPLRLRWQWLVIHNIPCVQSVEPHFSKDHLSFLYQFVVPWSILVYYSYVGVLGWSFSEDQITVIFKFKVSTRVVRLDDESETEYQK